MAAGPTAGYYANRDGEYLVLPDGTVWLIGGPALPQGSERVLLEALPPDAAMTEGAMGGPAGGGSTPPGRGPESGQAHRDWDKPKR
ncbi:MAG TPA: hypothetical protein VKX45_18525 [Bryobacteraceae bacterium]|jgi:hypothetical protein|nr:hypothetical protein [Bryobacteraceae bacterium]